MSRYWYIRRKTLKKFCAKSQKMLSINSVDNIWLNHKWNEREMKTCLFRRNGDDCSQPKGRAELHGSFVHFFFKSCIFARIKRRISSCISILSELISCHNEHWQCYKNKQKNIPFGLKFIQIEKLVHQFLI